MHTRSRRKPRQNTLLFEELEPRLLFSADAAEALTGMAVEQSVEEEPEVAAAEEPAADSVDQSTAADTSEPVVQPAAQEQPGETADIEAAPPLLESETPAEADPADAEPAATGEPVLPADADIDPAQPVAESTAQPATTAETIEPAAQADGDGDGAIDPQKIAPVLVDPAATGEPATLIDSTAAADEPTATADSIESAASDQPAAAGELVFVDAAVRDGQTLVDSLLAPREDDRAFTVVVLDADRDGIDQVSTALAGYDNLQAIHFLSHGGDGELLLGSTRLDSTSLSLYTDAIAGWGTALADSGDILLYGCDIAASADGRFLVDSLSQLTGADVAASTDATGLAALGGDWDLEYLTGTVETSAAIDPQTQQEWSQVLAAITTGTSSSAGTGTKTTATSLTWSHTIGSGSNSILLVNVAMYDDKAAVQVNSVTYGGTALTRLGSVAGARTRAEMWYLKAPASGTANIVVTTTASVNFTAGATTFFNVDQTAPFGTPVTGSGSTNPSLTVASAPGELVIDVIAERDIDTTGSVTALANQTPLWVQWNGSDSADATGASSSEAGAASVTMSWTTTGAGAGEWAAMAVSLKPATNTAPALDGLKSPTLNALLEDTGTPVGAVGTLVASLVDLSSVAGGLDNVTDPDSGALTGIAVTAVDTANGAWWYSINNGATWSALGTVSDASARLLAADTATRLYFQPTPDWNGTFDAITFRAWDRTSGSNGTLADTTDNGGSTAFSTATDTATLTVTPVNDAPGVPTASLFMEISEDTANPWGKPVADFTATMADADADALKGIAVYAADSTNGAWQYTLDGGTNWQAIGLVSMSSARLLPVDQGNVNLVRVRFVPNPDFNGTVYPFGYYGWDQTQGTAGALYDVSMRGGTTAFSTSGPTVSQAVSATNDAPTALTSGATLTAIAEDTADPAGATVSTLFAATFSDAKDQVTGGSSANTFAGVAVVANAATSAGAGAWQWYNGTSWTDIGTSVSTSSALALAPDTLVRFLPAANYYGTPGALTVRLIDNSAGAVTSGSTLNIGAGGATTAYSDSSNAVTLSTSITPVNDAPVGLPVITGSVVEDQTLTADTSGLSDVDGLGALSYQWLRGGVAITGATDATYTLGDSDVGATIAVAVSYTDGGGTAEAVTSAAVGPVANVNDAPVVTMTPTPVLFLADPIAIDPTLTVTDVDNANLVSAQVYFGKGFQKGHDRLEFINQSGITGSFNNNSGILTLTGTASVADYQTALRSVQYRDANPTPARGILYVHIIVSDGLATSNVATRVIEVVDNLPPRGGDDSATVDEGASVLIDLAANDTDAENKLDLTSIVITTTPTWGSVTVNDDGTVTYTHDGSETISDTFWYTIRDLDLNTSSPVPVSITVVPVNDLPTAANNTVTTSEDSPYTFTAADFNFSDNDGDSLASVRITSLESAGSLLLAGTDVTLNQAITRADIDAGKLTYAPLANDNGAAYDSFGFSVNDGTAGSAASYTMTIDVTQVNDTGTFDGPTSATIAEDASASGTLTFTDAADGFTTPNFRIEAGGQASHGTAAIDADGVWTYTPTANWLGTDSFTVSVTDDDGNTETRAIEITVTPVADLSAQDDSFTINEDTPLSASVATNDSTTSGGSLSYALDTGVSNGSLSLNSDGSFTYIPTANFNGADSFTYTVTDAASGESATQTVEITVNQVNDVGTFGGDTSATIDEDAGATGTLTFTDTADGASAPNFRIEAGDQAGNGTAAIDATSGAWTYTPTVNWHGSDSFTVAATDDDGNVESQIITITVNQVNDAGTFGGDTSATIAEDTSASGMLTFTDAADGFSTPNFIIAADGTNGTATIDGSGAWTYTPTANWHGSDSFTVAVTDDDGNVESQIITITVNQVNDAGTFGGDTSATIAEDTSASGMLTFTDAADGASAPNFTVTALAGNGTATIDATSGAWTYTPGSNWLGTDSFTVSVTDDDGNTETRAIEITVTPVADLSAQDDSFTINEDTPLSASVATNDSTTSGGSLSYALDTGVSNGSLSLNSDGSFTYIPTANFNGADSFTYTVTDAASGESATQTVEITVNQVNDVGTFGGDTSATIDEDAGATGTLTFTDVADGATTPNFRIEVGDQAGNGIAAIDAASGAWTYTPTANWHGTDSFTVAVTDDDGNVESQIITITVNPVTDLSAQDDSFATSEDTPLSASVATNDTTTSGGSLSYALATGVSSGNLNLNNDGSFTYTPTANFNGADSFTYTVTDAASGESATRTVSITVTQVDDAGAFGGDTTATIDEDAGAAGTLTFTDAADGASAPNFTVTGVATSGIAVIDATSGAWTYTPTANWHGTDSFTVSVTDDDGNVETQLIEITVTPVNDPGTFGGDLSATVSEDASAAGILTFTDAADGASAPNFTVTGVATSGIAAIDATSGAWTYTPTANWHGSDSFTVSVTDDDGNVETQLIEITVTPVNDPGTFGGDLSATVSEDASAAGILTFTDAADGASAPNFTVTGVATSGIAAIDATSGAWTYTPTANWHGSDSFTVSVTDDDGNVETQLIEITVTQVNDPGIFGGDTSATITEDAGAAGTLTFTDAADGFTTPNFRIEVGDQAGNGIAAIDAASGAWTYTPTANWHGTDSFTVSVTDDDGNVETQLIEITVTQVNDPGTFVGDLSATVSEDAGAAGTLTFTDAADGASTPNFRIEVGDQAGNGTAAIDATTGAWTYTPTANWHGSDSFTVSVTDDDGNVESQTVTITVTPVKDLTAQDDSFTVEEDATLSASVATNDTTTSGGSLSYGLATGVSNGSLSFNSNGSFTYTPTANYNGSDSFTYTVTDAASGESATQTVSITVTPVTDLTAQDDSFTVNEDATLSTTVATNDTTTSGGSLSYALATDVSSGSLTLNNDGSFIYTPTANFNGSDSFTYTVTDAASGESATQTVSFTVTQVNDTGTFDGATSATIDEDASASGALTFTDAADGFTTPNFRIEAGGQASHGTAAIDADGVWTYTPTANWHGTDSFTVSVTDDDGNVETQLIEITVTQMNDPGTFGGATSATIAEDTSASGILTFTDAADGFSTPNFIIAADGTNGTATIDGSGAWTYTPTANWHGSDSFTVAVTDDDGNVESQIITITVNPVTDLSAQDDSFATSEDTPLSASVATNDTTTSGGSLSYALATGVSSGNLNLNNDGSFTYTPTANFNGADSFTYTVTYAASGESATQTVSITVTQVADLTGTDDSFTTSEDTLLNGNVSLNDTTTSGGSLSYAVDTGVSNGSLNLNSDGSFTYTPTANFNGADSFTYTVTDAASGESATQTVAITVTQVNDAGTFTGATSTTIAEDTSASSILTFTDAADGATAPNFTVTALAGNGAATIDAATGAWTYTPTGNWHGSDSFTVAVTDDDGNVESQIITITVNPVTDLTAADDSFTVEEDATLSATVAGNDSTTSGGSLSYGLATGVSNGSLSLNSDGSFTYTPTANFNGADSFTYTVTDAASGESATKTVAITINAVNDAPVAARDTVGTDEDTAISGNVLINDSDIDGDTLTAALVAGPAHGSLTLNTDGSFTYTPDANWYGEDSFTYTAKDDTAASAATVTITVAPVNDAPTLAKSLANRTGVANEPFTLTVAADTFSDVDRGDSLTYRASGLPAWLSFDPASRTFSGTPADGDAGRMTITVRATDSAGAWVEDSFDLTVANGPDDPVPPGPQPPEEPVTPPEEPVTPAPPVVDDGEALPVEPPAPIVPVEQPTAVEPAGPTVLQPDDPLLHAPEFSPTVPTSFDPLQPVDTNDPSATEQESETEPSPATVRRVPGLAVDQALVATPGPTQGVPVTAALQVVASPADSALGRRKDDPSYLTPTIQLGSPATLEFTMPVLPATAAEYFHLEDLQTGAPYAADTASEIDAVLRQMDQSAATRGETEQFITYMASGLSLSLTAGFASYLLRAGSLLSSLLATVPIWRNMDPLAILVAPKKKKPGKDPDDPAAPTATPDEQVENLFTDRERP